MAGDGLLSKGVSQTCSTPCKVVLLGKEASGKSCLVSRFMRQEFKQNTSPTIGAAFGTKTIHTDKGAISLQIWDTAGQERYRALANLYYRKANAAIVCCDMTCMESYNAMEFWLKQLREAEKDCKIYICGNKADLIWDNIKPRAVSLGDLQRFELPFFETSSKANYNITELFQTIANEMEIVHVSDAQSLQVPMENAGNGRGQNGCC